jgi:hypothetical protein
LFGYMVETVPELSILTTVLRLELIPLFGLLPSLLFLQQLLFFKQRQITVARARCSSKGNQIGKAIVCWGCRLRGWFGVVGRGDAAGGGQRGGGASRDRGCAHARKKRTGAHRRRLAGVLGPTAPVQAVEVVHSERERDSQLMRCGWVDNGNNNQTSGTTEPGSCRLMARYQNAQE